MPRVELYLLVGAGFIVCVVGLVAAVAPPNTNDALTYHMPRVVHWIQDRSVAFYPTHILRQLYLSPGSEFILLHFQILSGSDHLANFVQWFSMLGSAVAVSLIAKELGSGAARAGLQARWLRSPSQSAYSRHPARRLIM